MHKVTVVTGSSKGIGRYLAEYYLGKGHCVSGCSRTESDLVHANYDHFLLDVADEKAVRSMVTRVYRKHGRIDHLLNNAGVSILNHSLLTPLSMVERIVSTNLFGTFLFCREAGKIMTKQRFGRIVNFSSVAVPLALEGEAAYAAAKSAVETLTRVLARELAPSGITCNAIGPSPIPTDLIRNVSEQKMGDLLARQAIRELGTFEDVSNVLDFFLSEKSGKVTGQVLYLCGVS
ncbi:MAG: SDR family oxidoreductase [bacterium]